MNGLVIYTAISGGKDTLKQPEHVLPGVRYVCFTDSPPSDGGVFEIHPLPFAEESNVLTARKAKILAHQLFPEHETSLWMDGSKQIMRDLTPLLKAALDNHDFTALSHPWRNSLFEEVEECVRTGRLDGQRTLAQAEYYRQQGMPERHGRFVQTGLLFRRHNSPALVKAMECWWQELSRSTCDQVSLPYALWKNGYDMQVLEHDRWHDDHFRQTRHVWYVRGDNRNGLRFRLKGLLHEALHRCGLYEPLRRLWRRLR